MKNSRYLIAFELVVIDFNKIFRHFQVINNAKSKEYTYKVVNTIKSRSQIKFKIIRMIEHLKTSHFLKFIIKLKSRNL